MPSQPIRKSARRPRTLIGCHQSFACQSLEERRLLATIAWDGGAGDGNFTNPLNWDGDVMPGVDDDAIITPGAGPFIELRAGDTASLKSLTVYWPLAVNGNLGVSDQATIGANFFDIGATGRLETNNLTLEAATGSVLNQGHWTIGGTSLIDRRIVSDGELVIAQGATITLGIGLNAALQYGSIDVTGGQMTVREGASITGGGRSLNQVRVATTLTIDGGASFVGVGLDADGSNLAQNVRVNFGPLLTTTFNDASMRLEYGLVTGNFDLVDSDLVVRRRAIMTGVMSVEGGSLDLASGILLVRPPLTSPGQPSSLVVRNADVTITGTLYRSCWLYGNIEVHESPIVATRYVRLGNGLTLRGVELQGNAFSGNATQLFFEGATTASDLSVTGAALLRVQTGSTLTLDGGANRIETQMVLRGTINWTDGDLLIEIVGGTSNLRTYLHGTLSAVFTGPGSHRLDIIGDDRYRHLVLNGTLCFAFDDPTAEVLVNGPISNRGTITVTGGILHYESGLISFYGGSFGGKYGDWIVGPGATLDIDEAFTTHRGLLTIIGDGQVPALASITLNTGVITFDGEGDGPLGPASSSTLRNSGTIRKIGAGVRILTGSITNLVAGTIAVEGGQLEIDAPLFINRGTLAIGSDQFMSPRAVFRTTGDYREGGHALLEIVGTADGDPDDLPRFGVDGRMDLAGDLRIDLSTTAPFAAPAPWQLGFAAERIAGRFASNTIVLPTGLGTLTYGLRRVTLNLQP